MTRSAPCLGIKTADRSKLEIIPVRKTVSSRSAQRSRVLSLTTFSNSTRGFPEASACDHPVNSSATLLMERMQPAVSVVITPSPIEYSVTASRSFSAARAVSDCCKSRLIFSARVRAFTSANVISNKSKPKVQPADERDDGKIFCCVSASNAGSELKCRVHVRLNIGSVSVSVK